MDFKNFGGGYLSGSFKVNSSTSANWDIRIDFLGDSTQKAHRFVLENDSYIFKDVVDVPFSVTRTDKNIKLNVSFFDENNDGNFNLTEEGNEYIYIHSTDYTGGQVDEIAVKNGLKVKNMYVLLPVMKQGKIWDPDNLSAYKITVDNYLLKGKMITSKRKTFWYKDSSDDKYAHADHHALVIFKVTGTSYSVLDGNDGGIAVSNDKGENWESPIHGYVTSQFYSVSKHPSVDSYLGGMQDNGTWFSNENPAYNSFWNEALGGDDFGSVWHSRKPEQMIASLYYNQLYRTDNKWKNLYDISDQIDDSGDDSGAPFITTIASSPDEPDLLFVAGPTGLWKSDDFGMTWKVIYLNPDDYGYSNGPVQMEISKADPKIVWAGVKMDGSGKLNLSVNMGKSFTTVENFALNIRRISRIISDPFDPNIVYVLSSAPNKPKIIRSKNSGHSWKDISGFGTNSSSSTGFPNVATYSLLVMPHNTNEIWAGTEIGLFISDDDGQTWHYSNNGLPAVCIWDMKIVGDQVILGIHGRGIWSVTIPELNDIPAKPYITGAGVTVDNKFRIRYDIRSDFDSLIYYWNGYMIGKEAGISQGMHDYIVDKLSETPNISCQVVGYKDGRIFLSNLYNANNYEISYSRVRYFNDFEIKQSDFCGEGFYVNNNFEGRYAINSKHPYDERKDLFYLLKYPIVVMEEKISSGMTYEDIAFVEKGEPGSSFGDDDFWDYVIVEGSKDGIDWLPLADGYDFGFTTKWDDGNTDINSTPVGDRFVRGVRQNPRFTKK